MMRNLITVCFLLIMLLCAGLIYANAREVTEKQSSGDKQCKLFPIEIDNKFGYIDNTGKMIIEPRFESAFEFTGGFARVWEKNRAGFIDEAGNLVISYKYYNAGAFSEGLADVRWDGGSGYIDKTGQVIIDSNSSQTWSFSDGLAAVSGKDASGTKKWGFIDKSGKWVIPPRFDNAYIFSEGFAAIELKNKVRYIDKTGRIISAGFIEGEEFSGGLAAVKVGQLFGLNKKWGFIDKTGKLKIKPGFAEVNSFSEGLAAVNSGTESNPKWQFINKAGDVVISSQFTNALDFSESLVGVKSSNGKWGFADKTGAVVIQPSYDYIFGSFCGGLAKVGINDKKDKRIKIGYINAKGIYVWQPS